METPIQLLRVEQSAISKELKGFRACDSQTRSLYCREWAQYIYKKHFVWSAKTQEEIVPDSLRSYTLHAGKYQINYLGHEEGVVGKKERSVLLGKKFEELALTWKSEGDNSLLAEILKGCQLWMTLPSGYTGLPDSFEPVEFNPFPDAIPLVEDPKDPSQLLDPLIIERQALCLPSDCFHLLKNLIGDILLSHTTPTCHHSKPTAKTPADLELDRTIFNEHEHTAVNQVLKELSFALESTWAPLNSFLQQLEKLEERRNALMGKGCQARIDQFVADQKYISFVDRWSKEQQAYKNKKSTEEEMNKIDGMLSHHLETLKGCVKEFNESFVPKLLVDINALTTDLWKMIVPTMRELGERMTARESSKKGSDSALKFDQSLKSLDMEYFKNWDATKDESNEERIVDNLRQNMNAYYEEIDNFFKEYQTTSRPNLSGRLEKLNNKEFKKRIKKLESGYYSIRQTFRQEVTENVFPEPMFCKFALACLEPLLHEGEMMEVLTIETEVKRFLDAHRDLCKQRDNLVHQFEEGVQTGRRELAGILGTLFLKEGMRIQGDNLALKRQNSLLKSMGIDVPEKKSSKKKSASSGTSTPAQQLEPVPTVSSPVKKSPFKKLATVTPPAEPVDIKKVESPKTEPVKKVESPKAEPVKKVESPKTEPVKKVESPKVEPVKKAVVKSLPLTPTPVKTVESKVEEEKPEEKKKKVEEKKPEEKKVEERKRVMVEEKKVEKKPAIEEKKPEYKKFDNRKPLASDLPPLNKVKSSKIPAPAPIIEPKVEPKPIEKKKKVVAPKKKEPVVEKKKPVVEEKKPVVEEAEENWTVVEEKKPMVAEKKWPNVVEQTVKPVADDVQDWNSILASVADEPAVETYQVQDWNDLRAQFQSEEATAVEQKKVEPNAWTGQQQQQQQQQPAPPPPLETGWSSIAAKKPEPTWSNAATAASSATDSLKDLDMNGGWKKPNATSASAAAAAAAAGGGGGQSPALSVASSAWSTTATVGVSGSNGWNSGEKSDWNNSPVVNEKKTSAPPPGLNTKPVAATPSGLNTKTAAAAPSPPPGLKSSGSGWNTSPVDKASNGWNTTPVDKVSNGWNTPPVDTKVSNGWNTPPVDTKVSNGWNTPPVDTKVSNGWNTSPVTEKKSTVTTDWNTSAPIEKSSSSSSSSSNNWNTTTEKTGSGWNSPAASTSPTWNKSEKNTSAPSGWGPMNETTTESSVKSSWRASEVEKPTSKAGPPPGLEEKKSTSWAANDKVETGGWNEKATKSAAAAGWDAVQETPSLGGWGNPKIPASWNASKKKSTATTTTTTTTTASAASAANKPVPAPAPATMEPTVISWESIRDEQNASWEEEKSATTTTVTTPTATISNSKAPPGLMSIESSMCAPMVPSATTSFGLSGLSSNIGIVPLTQHPLPGDLAEMKPEMVVMICQNLHRENASLIQTTYALQQEMSTMTTRYTEIMGLAREREAQTLQLYESRRQTEMEEIKRYVLSLEARIKQMEGAGGAVDRVTAGFGNQDLFAGYREEMRSTTTPQPQHNKSNNNYHRKLWKNNNVIRCGNCGETGHESSECKTNCRYCGSSDHLSESCPMN